MSMLNHTNECIVVVRRQWNDCQFTASYHLDDISNFHWTDVSGGVRAVAHQPFGYGYVLCDQMIKRTKGPPTVNISMGRLPLNRQPDKTRQGARPGAAWAKSLELRPITS
jgi:hypothetical protein